LTIKQLPALIEKINEWNQGQNKVSGRWKSEKILHSFNTSPVNDNIYNFGPDVFGQDFKRVLELMPNETEIQRGHLKSMQGIADALANSPLNVPGIEKLKKYLDELDFRRNTNWRDHFPWLDQDFSVQYHNDSN
jgi:hypothetical protein